MGDVKNLQNQEAAKKIQELATEIQTCMFCTYDGDKLQSRPMSTQLVDDNGTIWFLSDKNSQKNVELTKNNSVELLYAGGHSNFLSVHGSAEITFDKAIIEKLWAPIAKIWFKEGKDDPNVSAIKVTPSDAYYWDTKHGKMVEFFKMAASLATGKTMDDGIEGTLEP